MKYIYLEMMLCYQTVQFSSRWFVVVITKNKHLTSNERIKNNLDNQAWVQTNQEKKYKNQAWFQIILIRWEQTREENDPFEFPSLPLSIQ